MASASFCGGDARVSRCFAASGKISTVGEFELGLAAVTERAISLIPFFPHASHRSRRRRFLTAAAPSFPSLPTVPYCELLFAARFPVDLWTCAPPFSQRYSTTASAAPYQDSVSSLPLLPTFSLLRFFEELTHLRLIDLRWPFD